MGVRIGRWGLLGSLTVLLTVLLVTGALAAPSRQSSATVQVASNAKYGSILVNGQGMTLYTLSSEAGGAIQCTGACLTAWPALLLQAGTSVPTAGPGVTGTLGVVARPEGGMQVTYNGFPLYTFAGDSAAGDTNGEGIPQGSGTWHLVQVSAGTPATASPGATGTPSTTSSAPLISVASSSSLGPILVTSQGRTLYYNTAELAGKLVCTGKCLTVWPPLDLPAGVASPTVGPGVTGAVSAITRPEGDHQVTYGGFPLYTFVKDTQAGDTHGQGIVALGGIWYAARPDSVPLSATLASRMTLHITTDQGKVWGTVAVRYLIAGHQVQQACSSATCHLGVPLGVVLHIVQTPADAASRPFREWKVKTAGHVRTRFHSTLRLTIHGASTITTVYSAR